ncbi:helix-turn-helix domain-containing protein [Streptomyces sp. NPDC014006]|uniref:AraC-like ligand-binding domain-containing protein n=1 Tax=Streptomyces sp. NPDC014006 TaxID=3364870 RepID=UPI0036FD27DF
MQDEVSTASMPGPDRARQWQHAVRRRLAPVEVTLPSGAADFHGTLGSGDAGRLRLLSMRAAPLRLSRPAPSAPDEPEDRLVLLVQKEGTGAVRQDGRETVVRAGQLALLDLRRPFTLDQHTPFHLYALRLPERALGPSALHVPRVTGRAIAAADGVAALLRTLATDVACGAAALAGHVRERLAGHLADLVATVVDEQARGHGASAPDTPRALLITEIRTHIDARLRDPALSPARVADAHGISLRYLHVLFEDEDTTVHRLIQQRRIEECARELLRRARVSRTISAVARGWGFQNAAHFSRAFKSVYGCSPSEWRDAGRNYATTATPGPASGV